MQWAPMQIQFVKFFLIFWLFFAICAILRSYNTIQPAQWNLFSLYIYFCRIGPLADSVQQLRCPSVVCCFLSHSLPFAWTESVFLRGPSPPSLGALNTGRCSKLGSIPPSPFFCVCLTAPWEAATSHLLVWLPNVGTALERVKNGLYKVKDSTNTILDWVCRIWKISKQLVE